MVRGGITFLILVGLVSRLVIPVSHAHAHHTPEEQAEHSAVPHTHIGGGTHVHSHRHDVPVHGHDPKPCQSPESGLELAVVPAPERHHDSDAVWLPMAAASKHCVNPPANTVTIDAHALDSHPVAAGDRKENSWRLAARGLRGPPSRLYLLLRTLRN